MPLAARMEEPDKLVDELGMLLYGIGAGDYLRRTCYPVRKGRQDATRRKHLLKDLQADLPG